MRTPLTCPVCGRESTPTARHAAVRCEYVSRVNRRKVWRDGPVCGDCAAEAATTIRLPVSRLDTGQCEVCGLRVAVRRDPRRTRFVCSEACRVRGYREPVEKTVTTCAQCGSEFQARPDARYCSSACRQRAFRSRAKVGE